MSRKKYSNSEVFLIVQRAMDAFGCKRKKDLANIFGILPQDMTGRIKRGTIINLIEKESYKRNVNFNYLLTGESSPISENQQHPYPLDTPGHIPASCQPYSELIKKTCEILESGTYYATVLTSNIIAFHNAVKDGESAAERFEKIEQDIEQLKVSPKKAKKAG